MPGSRLPPAARLMAILAATAPATAAASDQAAGSSEASAAGPSRSASHTPPLPQLQELPEGQALTASAATPAEAAATAAAVAGAMLLPLSVAEAGLQLHISTQPLSQFALAAEAVMGAAPMLPDSPPASLSLSGLTTTIEEVELNGAPCGWSQLWPLLTSRPSGP